MGYLANFMVYTLAMVGVIVVALLVFKGATSSARGGKSSKCLKIVDTMSLGPRKTLYIVSAGNERFLIAGDVDKTSLISKLNSSDTNITVDEDIKKYKYEGNNSDFGNTQANIAKHNYADVSQIGIKSSLITDNHQNSVMKNLASVLRK